MVLVFEVVNAEKTAMEKKKPKVKIVGEDGNAFLILAKAKRALKEAGYPKEEIDRYYAEATKGSYDNLLAVTCEWCDVS